MKILDKSNLAKIADAGFFRVSIHAPVRVRPRFHDYITSLDCFNSRTREGATKPEHINTGRDSFNSRTREGATSMQVFVGECVGFNSRTREGATTRPTKSRSSRRFNSRTREGATPEGGDSIPRRRVSIHAPVRVRHTVTAVQVTVDGFNSRTREGATERRLTQLLGMPFQFTHP